MTGAPAPHSGASGGRGSTFVMTGLPRSGTTYLSAVLHRPPSVVTISDPGGVWKQFQREHGTSPRILERFQQFRAEILAGDEIPVLDGTEGFEGRGRVDTWNQKKVLRSVPVAPDFDLGMKNPEVFLAHLPVFLDAGIRCLVCVRHPVSVIGSWVAKKLRKKDGEPRPWKGFSNGESIVYRSKASDAVARRIDLHNHLTDLILKQHGHPGLRVVLYDDWFERPELLDEVCEFVGIPSPGELRPAPMAPSPAPLPAGEQERIRRECTCVAALGIPLDGDRLAPPASHGT